LAGVSANLLRGLTITVGAAVSIGVGFLLDDRAANLAAQEIKSGQIRTTLVALRFFGDGAPLVLMTFAAILADPKRWRLALLTLCAAFAAGFYADRAKTLTARRRPDAERFTTKRVPIPAAESWKPDEVGGRNSSFPSGHSATAFAYARGMALQFSRLAPVLYLAATGVAVSRMHELRHFLSDCIVGGLFGLLLASVMWAMLSERPPASAASR
jgi:undecaprenyl-diphosphatase